MPLVQRVRGLVWSADVVGFTRRSAATQTAIIRGLSDWLGDHPIFEGLRRNEDFFVHGTGDGFILAFLDRDDLPLRMIHAAGDLVRRCRALRDGGQVPACRVRQGLHVGTFVYPVELFGNVESVGDGLNRGSYVAGAAGPDQIYASEDFIQHLVSVMGAATVHDRLLLHPPLETPPFVIPVKHGGSVGIRHVGLPGVDWSHLSPTLSRLYETHQRLEEQLRLIQQAVEGSLVADDPDVDGLGTRVAIWTVQDDKLVPTRLRRVSGGAARSLGEAPRSMRPPAGPISRAVAEDRTIVVVGPPGALVAVPFRFGAGGVQGAITVDFAAPLEGMEDVLGLLARIIREREAEHVAALLQLRWV